MLEGCKQVVRKKEVYSGNVEQPKEIALGENPHRGEHDQHS
jgi:hypothetical protein